MSRLDNFVNSKGGRCCGLTSLSVFLSSLAYGDSTFSTTDFSLTFGNDGRVSSAIRMVDQSELVPYNGSGEGWYLHQPESDLLDQLSMMDLGNDRLQFTSATDPDLLVVVKVTEENRVRIPPGLVEWALSVAPKRVVLCDRHGNRETGRGPRAGSTDRAARAGDGQSARGAPAPHPDAGSGAADRDGRDARRHPPER